MPKIRTLDVTEERWDPSNEDEALWWPRILWLDPGVVSGVATVWFDPAALLRGEPLARCLLAVATAYLSGPELGPRGMVSGFLSYRRELIAEQGLAVGCETFTPRQINFDPAFLAPVRVRAAVEYELSMESPHTPLHLQSPSDAFGAFSNDRLKRLGLFTEGPDHKNDAMRHALLWIQRVRNGGADFLKAAHGYQPRWME